VTEPLLTVREVDTYYGDAQVLNGVSLEVAAGEVVALLGRHGAGKTTTLRTIMGLTPPRGGTVRLRAEDIAGEPAFAIAARGIGFVPEDRRIFPSMSVRENLEVARRGRGYGLAEAFGDFPELKAFERRAGRTLSGGEQQMLTIARTLMGSPSLLLLDEPTEGLAPIIVERIDAILRRTMVRGLTVLLAEQNAAFALSLAARVYVVDDGRVVWKGSVSELRARPDVMGRYLAVGV
jgi:branched-chain amino acid transport system ATP-binding protein